MNNSETFRQRMGRQALEVANMVRRVVVSASKGGAWSVGGYAIPDLRGGSTITTEGEDDDPAEVFGGIGIWARPAGGDRAEGLLLNVGGKAEHGVICAVRNEDARKRYVEEFGSIGQGEIALFPSTGTSRVLIKQDGSIEITPAAGKKILIKTKDGTTDSLVTRTEFLSHGHPTAPMGPVSPPSEVVPSGSPDPFPGTQALESE